MTSEYERKLITGIPSDQKWGCFSFLRKLEADSTISVIGVRFGGAYSTLEAAQARCKEIQLEDTRFNVFVGELNGDFLPYDPDPNSKAAGDSEYANEQLNSIMKGHEESQKKAALFHELRKTQKMIDNINENLEAQHKNKEDLVKKLSKTKTLDEAKTLTNCIDGIDSQIKKMESRLKECAENEVKLKEQTMGTEMPSE